MRLVTHQVAEDLDDSAPKVKNIAVLLETITGKHSEAVATYKYYLRRALIGFSSEVLEQKI